MPSIKDKVEDIRKRPYQERIKILWFAIAVTVILVIALWVVTIKVRDLNSGQEQNKILPVLENGFEQLKNNNPFSQ